MAVLCRHESEDRPLLHSLGGDAFVHDFAMDGAQRFAGLAVAPELCEFFFGAGRSPFFCKTCAKR